MNKQPDQVRDEVREAYAKYVTIPTRGCGCCGSSAEPKGAVAGLAGYSEEELGSIPTDAASNSFGCGNPVALAGLREGNVVVDLGSGAGIDLFLAAKKVGPKGRVIGIDMTDEMLEVAKENIRAGGYENVEVRKGLIEALPVETGTVDWVISNCVINLSPEKHKVFAEIARVLKPGGQMLVSDIVAEDLPEAVLNNAALYSSCVAGAISEEQYLSSIRAAGLIDAMVRDRLVYDADQLEVEILDSQDSKVRKPLVADKPRIKDLIQAVAGKIASIKVYARKPK
jgi:arsenite methyltransferase